MMKSMLIIRPWRPRVWWRRCCCGPETDSWARAAFQTLAPTGTSACFCPGWWRRPRRETLTAAPPGASGRTGHCSSSPEYRSTSQGRPAHMPTWTEPSEAAAETPRQRLRRRRGEMASENATQVWAQRRCCCPLLSVRVTEVNLNNWFNCVEVKVSDDEEEEEKKHWPVTVKRIIAAAAHLERSSGLKTKRSTGIRQWDVNTVLIIGWTNGRIERQTDRQIEITDKHFHINTKWDQIKMWRNREKERERGRGKGRETDTKRERAHRRQERDCTARFVPFCFTVYYIMYKPVIAVQPRNMNFLTLLWSTINI